MLKSDCKGTIFFLIAKPYAANLHLFFCDLVLKAKRYEISREYAVCQQKCVNLRIGHMRHTEIMAKITAQNTPITVLSLEEQDYISLTDMANANLRCCRFTDLSYFD